MATTKQFDIDDHPTIKNLSGLGSITGIYPFSIVRTSLVLAFLIAAVVATKLINGYLICSLTVTTFYLDLAIGVAMVIACGVIPLSALGINRDSKTKGASCCSTFAIVLVFALLAGILVFAVVAAVLNFKVAVPTNWSPFGIDLQRESQIEALQLQQLPSEDAEDRIFAYCRSNKTEGNPDILALVAKFERDAWSKNRNIFGMRRYEPIIYPPERCEEAEDLSWTTRQSYHLSRQDPFNVCSANDNDAIKAFFRGGPATFRLVQRIDVVFKALVGLLWLLPAVWTVVTIIAFICELSCPPKTTGILDEEAAVSAGSKEAQINAEPTSDAATLEEDLE